MSVSYDSYKVFYYVAYYKSITLAAKALYLTQPTVSHSISNLENELNCKLFIRSKKGVELTPEGEVLFQHIAKAYNEITHGEKELKEFLNMGKRLITIGTSETALRSYLIPKLGQFKTKYPQIHFRIHPTTCRQVDSAIKSGSLDLAIMTTPFPENDLEMHQLSEFSMVCIAGQDYAHLAEYSLSYQEIARYPMICLDSGASGRDYLDRLFLSHGVHLQPDIELSSADLITPAVEQNIGIGFVPRIFAENAILSNKVVELALEEALPSRSIYLLIDPQRQHSIACQKFMEELQSAETISHLL